MNELGRQRRATMPSLTPPPPPPPPTSIEGRVRDLEEARREQHRTNVDLVTSLQSMDSTLGEIKKTLDAGIGDRKAFARHRKWLDWATRAVLGAALVMLVHWAGKIALIVQTAKLP